jgi:hypothetical protein
LRLFEVNKLRHKWKINLIEDELTDPLKLEVGIPLEEKAYTSKYVAKKILKRVRKEKRDLVFFIHGFNNDLESVLERA